MKKQILNLGRALNKVEQKKVMGGTPLEFGNPCPCTTEYTSVPGSIECYYPGNDPFFPQGVCSGIVTNGVCC